LVSLIGPTYDDDAGYGMDANLYGGGFKHFDIEAFIEVVKAQDWKVRSKVQLWVKGAEEGMGTEPFTLIKLGRRSEAAVKAAATSSISKDRRRLRPVIMTALVMPWKRRRRSRHIAKNSTPSFQQLLSNHRPLVAEGAGTIRVGRLWRRVAR
jgi:hypothetical protein